MSWWRCNRHTLQELLKSQVALSTIPSPSPTTDHSHLLTLSKSKSTKWISILLKYQFHLMHSHEGQTLKDSYNYNRNTPPNSWFLNIYLILNSWIVSVDIEFISIDFFFSVRNGIQKTFYWILKRMSYPPMHLRLLQTKFSILRIAFWRKIFSLCSLHFGAYFPDIFLHCWYNQMGGPHRHVNDGIAFLVHHNSIWAKSWATEFGEILHLNISIILNGI